MSTVCCPHCSTELTIPAIFDKFLLTRLIARTEHANIYYALDQQLHRPVAVKILDSTGESEKIAAGAVREARAQAALNHRCIAHIYTMGRHKGQYYIVSELIEGGSAQQFLRPNQFLTEPQTLDLAINIAEGLRAAHLANLTHMDVKPANILIDSEQNPKLIEFGTAQFTRDPTTGIIGTLEYVAPEVVKGKKPGFLADIYSLGATIFHFLTGQPPFDAPDPVDAAKLRLSNPAPYLTDLIPNIQPSTADIVARLLATNPSNRPPDYDSVIAGLKEARRLSQLSGTQSLTSTAPQAPAATARATPSRRGTSSHSKNTLHPQGSRASQYPETRRKVIIAVCAVAVLLITSIIVAIVSSTSTNETSRDTDPITRKPKTNVPITSKPRKKPPNSNQNDKPPPIRPSVDITKLMPLNTLRATNRWIALDVAAAESKSKTPVNISSDAVITLTSSPSGHDTYKFTTHTSITRLSGLRLELLPATSNKPTAFAPAKAFAINRLEVSQHAGRIPLVSPRATFTAPSFDLKSLISATPPGWSIGHHTATSHAVTFKTQSSPSSRHGFRLTITLEVSNLSADLPQRIRLAATESANPSAQLESATHFEPARALFDFEASPPNWQGTGTAFEAGPYATNLLPSNLKSLRPSGKALASSYNARFAASGEKASASTGRLISRPFLITAPYLHLRIAGGHDARKVGFSVKIDGKTVSIVTAPKRGANQLKPQTMNLSRYLGQRAQIEIYDNDAATTGAAFIAVDDIKLSHSSNPGAAKRGVFAFRDRLLPDDLAIRPTGKVYYQRWHNTRGADGKDRKIDYHQLVTKLNRRASVSKEIGQLHIKEGGDHFAQRMSGYIFPPATANYTFEMSVDDGGILMLSTDHLPKNRRPIVHTGLRGVTSTNQYKHKSKPIHLEKGKPYFIEAIGVEVGGLAFLSIGWSYSGKTDRPIPGKYLAPLPKAMRTKPLIIAKVPDLPKPPPPKGHQEFKHTRVYTNTRKSDQGNAWHVLDIEKSTSSNGAKLVKQMNDGSIFVEKDKNKATEKFQLFATTDLKNITAIRLEGMPDPRLENNGPGARGYFKVHEFIVEVASANQPDSLKPIKLKDVKATHHHRGDVPKKAIDKNNGSFWSTQGKTGRAESATFVLEKPLVNTGELILRITILHQGTTRTLGRFRVAATTHRDPFKLTAPSRFRTDNRAEKFIAAKPLSVKADKGTTLSIDPSNTISASSNSTRNETYEATFRTNATHITAIQLLTIPDGKGNQKRIGYGGSAGFVAISGLEVEVAPGNAASQFKMVNPDKVLTSYEQPSKNLKAQFLFDNNPKTHWAVRDPRFTKSDQSVTLVPANPIRHASGSVIRVRFTHSLAFKTRRFALRITSHSKPEEIAPQYKPDTKIPGVVRPNPRQPFEPYELAINVGGDEISKYLGRKWIEGKSVWRRGHTGREGGQPNKHNDQDAPMFDTAAVGIRAFRIERLPIGRYQVELYFVENWSGETGKRQFNVIIEDEAPVKVITLRKTRSFRKPQKPLTKDVEVRDGVLDISFEPIRDQPILCGVAIKRLRGVVRRGFDTLAADERAVSPYRNYVMDLKPVAYWALNEGRSSKDIVFPRNVLFADIVEATDPYHAYPKGFEGKTLASRGPSGSAARGFSTRNLAPKFDGEKTYISTHSVANSPADVHNQLTLSAWVKLDARQHDQLIVGSYEGINHHYRLVVRKAEGGGKHGRVVFGGDKLFTQTSLKHLKFDGKWHHVVGVLDSRDSAGYIHIYIDGQRVAQISNQKGTLKRGRNTGLYIGGRKAGNKIEDAAKGQIDEISIFDRALSRRQIEQMYSLGTKGRIQ